VISPDLARELASLSERVSRQVGVLLDRLGTVTHVIVGDTTKLVLPDLGRARAGRRRFRGLRLLHTHVQGEPLSQDDLTDLSLLRLDLVGTLQVDDGGHPGTFEFATLLPPQAVGTPGEAALRPWRKEGPLRVQDLHEDFRALVDGLEGEFAAADKGIDRRDTRPRTILVGIAVGRDSGAPRRMAELERLADTAGLHVIDRIVQKRPQVDPRTLIGKGKLDEILVRSMYLEADLLVFDRDLGPSQGKTVSERADIKVIDRTQLILDIFAQHAHSADGRLQVELAQLKYLLPRLSVMHEGLSRLSGGIGGRGPGETKLEIAGRRARDRVTFLEKQLKELASRREVRRRQRKRSGVPVAAIVGYTNAGKSTLLNALTRADVLAEDKLFATLDTTSRLMRFPDRKELVLTDTVGFIEHLPETLLKAFKATLEELHDADLLLHVVDASDPHVDLHKKVVEGVLEELKLQEIPVLLLLNKVDRLDAAGRARVEGAHEGAVAVSALRREGLDALLAEIERRLWREGFQDLRPDSMRRAEAWSGSERESETGDHSS
jgi:GTP-binding protein HflX